MVLSVEILVGGSALSFNSSENSMHTKLIDEPNFFVRPIHAHKGLSHLLLKTRGREVPKGI